MNEIIDLKKANYPGLSDHRVVIVGGTGAVGEGIVRAWLKTGAHVVIPSRTESKAERFRQVLSDLAQPDKLDFFTGDYTGFEEAQSTAEHIVSQYGPVTDVVASIGGWWQGKKLWEISKDEWQRYFIDMTTTHTATARAWLPRLPQTGSYQLILGGSAVEPISGASIINMQQAALLMMRRVLSAESGNQPRVVSQILGPVITRMRRQYDPDWVSNHEVGLVSIGTAANVARRGEDFFAYNKSQMLKILQNLDIYPE